MPTLDDSGGGALFAIADLHGDLERAHAALRLCDLVDDNNAWSGAAANVTLVQTGDLVDRGQQSLEVLELFWGLKAQAQEHGGRVHTLLGNHEALNMEADYRYVHHAELAAVGRSSWERRFHPVEGDIGARLRQQHMAAVVAGEGACRTLFVHAGLRVEHLKMPDANVEPGAAALLDSLNRRLRTTLSHARERGGAFTGLTGNDGPLWYRGFSQRSDEAVCSEIRATLQAVGAWRMVVGHTITPSHKHALARCAGLLQMIDVGMSRAYYGSLAAWTCERAPDLGAGWSSTLPLYPAGDPLHRAPLQSVYYRPERTHTQRTNGGVDGDKGGDAKAETVIGGEGAKLVELQLPPPLAEVLSRRDLDRDGAAALSALCAAADSCVGLSVERTSVRSASLRSRREKRRELRAPRVYRWLADAPAHATGGDGQGNSATEIGSVSGAGVQQFPSLAPSAHIARPAAAMEGVLTGLQLTMLLIAVAAVACLARTLRWRLTPPSRSAAVPVPGSRSAHAASHAAWPGKPQPLQRVVPHACMIECGRTAIGYDSPPSCPISPSLRPSPPHPHGKKGF